MRLWTIQDWEIWQKLQLHGELLSNPTCGDDFADWRTAYEWMRIQMSNHLGTPSKLYPWWAWYAPKPDIRKYVHAKPSDQHLVRLELEIPNPSSRVLMSAFSAWEMVIGGGYVELDIEDYSQWEDQINSCLLKENDDLPDYLQQKLVASWERIFDIPALEHGGRWSTSLIQACIDRLTIRDVVGVTEFTTR